MHRSLFQPGIFFHATSLDFWLDPSTSWMSYILIKWSRFEYVCIDCVVHMQWVWHIPDILIAYMLYCWATCSAKLMFHMWWSYYICIDQLNSTYSWLPIPALHQAHPHISLQDFLNQSMRDTSKSERISQMPVWKMAEKSISTIGSVIPFTILQYNHLTGRSWDRDT